MLLLNCVCVPACVRPVGMCTVLFVSGASMRAPSVYNELMATCGYPSEGSISVRFCSCVMCVCECVFS